MLGLVASLRTPANDPLLALGTVLAYEVAGSTVSRAQLTED
jgi:hypothetical protein